MNDGKGGGNATVICLFIDFLDFTRNKEESFQMFQPK